MNPKKPKGMTYAEYYSLIREHRARRAGQAYGLRQQGLTYKQIGEMLDPPVSVERVRQMLARHERFFKRWNDLKKGVNTRERLQSKDFGLECANT